MRQQRCDMPHRAGRPAKLFPAAEFFRQRPFLNGHDERFGLIEERRDLDIDQFPPEFLRAYLNPLIMDTAAILGGPGCYRLITGGSKKSSMACPASPRLLT